MSQHDWNWYYQLALSYGFTNTEAEKYADMKTKKE